MSLASHPARPFLDGARRDLDWGPAAHDPENPFGRAATQAALDRRNAAADLPEDN